MNLFEPLNSLNPLNVVPGVQSVVGRTWRFVPVVVLATAAFASTANTAEACTCAPQSAGCGPSAEFWRATVVFLGRVAAVERVQDQDQRYLHQRRVRVEVREAFRGALPAAGREVVIFTGSLATCGYPFKPGIEYLIYATRQDDGRMATTACSRTIPLDRAAADSTYARDATAGRAPQGRIIGQARLATGHQSRWRPLPGVGIALMHDGARFTAITDEHGQYVMDTPGGGSYTLNVSLPETLYTLQGHQTIEVPDPRACTEVNIDVLFNGRVSGRVVDSGEKGVAGLTVSLVHPRRTGAAMERRRMLTRDDGAYEIDRVPPGPFELAIELAAGGDEDAASDGVSEEATITRASLSGGQRLSLGSFALPPGFKIVHVEGTVHGADGWPASGARVFLKGAADAAHILGAPAVTDSLGRFVIAARPGDRYQVFAERDGRDERASWLEFSDPVPVHAVQPLPPLRLTVRRRF